MCTSRIVGSICNSKHLHRLNRIIRQIIIYRAMALTKSNLFRILLANISNKTLVVIVTYQNHMHTNSHFIHLHRSHRTIKTDYHLKTKPIVVVKSSFSRMFLGNILNITLAIIVTYQNHIHTIPRYRFNR